MNSMRVKKIIYCTLFIFFINDLIGQIGVNTTNPHQSSALDISSNSKGIIIPRLTLAQRNAIASPAEGLMIFQVNNIPGFYFYDGSVWKRTSSLINQINDNDGNTEINTEKNPNENKIRFKLNNYELLQFSNEATFLMKTSSPNKNIFFGNHSGVMSSGSNNISIGDSCLINTSGSYNTAIGLNALRNLTTGQHNTAIGNRTLQSLVLFSGSTAIGHDALSNNIGFFNTAIGLASLKNNVSGALNTAVGALAMSNSTSGLFNTAVGYKSLFSNTSGDENTSVGYLALMQNTTGSRNTAIGSKALMSNTIGADNTAVGYASLKSSTTGSRNTALGASSLENSASGSDNTALGTFSVKNNATGNNNTAIGFSSMGSGTIGNNNTAIGVYALRVNEGNNNTAIGYNTLFNNTTGINNTGVGYQTLYTNTTGGHNTAIGAHADVGNGDLTNATAIGAHSLVEKNHSVILGGVNGVNGATFDSRVLLGSLSNYDNESAILDLNATNKGVLVPRMTNAERNAIANPAEGLLVYSTNNHNFWYYDGDTWQNFDNIVGKLNASEGDGITYYFDNSSQSKVQPGFGNHIVDDDGNSRAEVDFSTGGQNDYSNFSVKLRDTSVLKVESTLPFWSSTSIELGNKLNIFFGEKCAENFGGESNAANNGPARNIGVGYAAMKDGVDGADNIGIGSFALRSNVGGNNNIAIGRSALDSVEQAHNNVAIGNYALSKGPIIQAEHDVAIGYRALENDSYKECVGIGAYSNVNADYCSAIGARATAERDFNDEATMVLGAVNGANGATVDTKVGIGTSSPQAMLHVRKNNTEEDIPNLLLESVNQSILELEFKNPAQNAWFMKALMQYNSNTTYLSYNFGTIGGSFDEVYRQYGNGNATLAGSLTQNSDIRLKKDIKLITDVLPRIHQINGYTYHWKDKYKDPTLQFGVLAQEVKKVFPQLVHKIDKHYSVNYPGLTTLMIKAIQEEYQQLKSVEKTLEDNEQLIKEMEAAIELLEKGKE